MAGPHVAGVAALVISRFGDAQNPQNGRMRPTQVEQYLTQTADPQSCPEALPNATSGSLTGRPYAALPAESGTVQECQGGGSGHTSWYGTGEVDALNAVLHDTSGN